MPGISTAERERLGSARTPDNNDYQETDTILACGGSFHTSEQNDFWDGDLPRFDIVYVPAPAGENMDPAAAGQVPGLRIDRARVATAL